MRQIIYFSTAAAHQDAAIVAGILAVSREHNVREQVTGVLVAGGYRYLQIIEGAAAVIDALIGRIRRDDRHVSMTVLVDRAITMRHFADWSMAFCVEPQLGEYATFADMVDRMRSHVSDRKLRAQLDCFARSFVIPPAIPAPSPWTLATDYQADLALDRRH